MLTDASLIAIVFGVFFLAGIVKGTVGLGFPAVTIGLLAATLGFREAIALVLIPGLCTNAWQAVRTGQFVPVSRRLWPYFAAGGVTCAVAVAFSFRVDTTFLSIVLGVVLLIYAGSTLGGVVVPRPSADRERPLSAAFGGVNGVIAGMTGIFVVPSAAWFTAIGLDREGFVQAVGTWFLLCSVILLVSYGTNGALTPGIALVATVGLIPAFAGMAIGRRLRERLDEARFRTVVLLALLALGLNLIVRALLA